MPTGRPALVGSPDLERVELAVLADLDLDGVRLDPAALHADVPEHRNSDRHFRRGVAAGIVVNGIREGRQGWPLWTNALIQHGTDAGRDQVARDLHATGPTPSGAFVRLDCRKSESTVFAALMSWLLEDGRDAEPARLPIANGGTLFLDHVDQLGRQCQQLLHIFAERLAEAAAAGQRGAVGRLVVGTPSDLNARVRTGAFMAALHDALDKARVDLWHAGRRPACPRRRRCRRRPKRAETFI